MRLLRRWWWVLAIVLVVGIRLALPSILRSQIEQRASAALRANVHVGAVDLSLLRGGVALEDVTVRATDAPPDEESLIAWKRFAVWMRFLPLFRKTIRLAAVEIDSPHVALDRLQSGDINLAALVPASEPAAEPPPGEKPAAEKAEGEKPSGWKYGIDSIVLTRGGLRFRDLLVPGAEPVAIGLEAIQIDNIAFEPDVYGGPADIKFVAKLEQGAVHTRARFFPRPGGIAIDATLAARGLPIHRSRVYVPDVAWSDLTGTLALALRYRLETGGRNQLSGHIGLDNVIVWVAGLDEPALKWTSVDVVLGSIDLVKHDARVTKVALDGAILPVRSHGPDALPLLTAAKAAKQTVQARAQQARGGEPAPTWTWSVGALELARSTVRLLGDKPAIEVGLGLDAKDLSGPKHTSSPVKLALTHADGNIDIDGTLRLDPPGFDGSAVTARLGLSDFFDWLEVVPSNVLQTGTLDSKAHIALGSSAPTPGDITVTDGTFALDSLWVAAWDPKDFAVGAKRIAVGVQNVTVPGVLAPEPSRGRPMTVAVQNVELTTPYARLTRTPGGLVLPTVAPPDAKPAPDKPAPPAPSAPPPPAAGPPAGAPRVTVETMKIDDGRVDVMDRTVKPFYWGALQKIQLEAQRVRTPDVEIGKLVLHMESASKGSLDLVGSLGRRGQLELTVKDLALMPFNPYVTAFSPYSIARGSGFVTTKATIDGARYDTTTYVTLSGFDLASRSGQNIVLEQLGIPLTVALALLRDWRGNIDLTIPVKMDEKGTSVALGSIIGQALVKALVGAIMSPLKLVGAVLPTGGGGKAEALVPKPIRFRPGASVLDSAGADQVKELAAFLAGRPGVGVTLGAPPTETDVRGLREQALLAKLGPRAGVVGRIRSIGARGRIVEALEARSKGEEGPLSEDDAKTLDEYLKDVPPPSADAPTKLGTARVDLVEKTLKEDYGILPGQLARAEIGRGEPGPGEPVVSVEIGAAH